MISQLPGDKQCMNSDPHRLIAEPLLLICLLFKHSCPCSNWNRKWQPTTVFLPGKLHGQRRLAGYSPWGRRVRHDWTHTQTHTLVIREHAFLRTDCRVNALPLEAWLHKIHQCWYFRIFSKFCIYLS